VAGGGGVNVRTWQPAASPCFPGITFAVIAPESVNVPLGNACAFPVPTCGAVSDDGPQPASSATIIKTRGGAGIAREVLKVNTIVKACTNADE